MSNIESRLKASVRSGAVHGNDEERAVCERQMLEAASEIVLLRAGQEALQKHLSRLIRDLEVYLPREQYAGFSSYQQAKKLLK